MTIPYIQGAGDTLKEGLPQIGKIIRNLVNPHAEAEDALYKQIQADPSLMGRLAEVEGNNPGSLGLIYGPNVAKFAQTLKLSPQQELQKTVTSATADVARANPQAVGEAALGLPSEAQRALTANQVEASGLSLANAKSQDALGKIAADAMGKYTIKQIVDANTSGSPLRLSTGDAPASDILQGIANTRPQALEAYLKQLDRDAEYQMRLDLMSKEVEKFASREDKTDARAALAFTRNTYLETARRAKASKLPANALFIHDYGEDAYRALMGADPTLKLPAESELNQIDQYYSTQRTLAISKALGELGDAKSAEGKSAARLSLNTVLESNGVNDVRINISSGKYERFNDATGEWDKINQRGLWDRILNKPIIPQPNVTPRGLGRAGSNAPLSPPSNTPPPSPSSSTGLSSTEQEFVDYFTDQITTMKVNPDLAYKALTTSPDFLKLPQDRRDAILSNLPASGE